MSLDYYEDGDGDAVPIYHCRECGDPTEGDPNLCWGCDPAVNGKGVAGESKP